MWQGAGVPEDGEKQSNSRGVVQVEGAASAKALWCSEQQEMEARREEIGPWRAQMVQGSQV